ncbi:hypothetical protein VP277E431_P0052 [Vibrio phage 277E43-1]|nr:hypothetical protein VP277E431_P0052 [Vibrio phage 277E43-1]
MKRVLEEMSPCTLVDPMKTRILFNEHLSETYTSLEEMTLDELVWMNEQIEIREYLTEARMKDENRMNTQSRPAYS